jgi:polyisoprenoid-binding protein YceI
MITKITGRVTELSATITIDDESERSRFVVELEVASIDTGNPERDAHLRSADFFDRSSTSKPAPLARSIPGDP